MINAVTHPGPESLLGVSRRRSQVTYAGDGYDQYGRSTPRLVCNRDLVAIPVIRVLARLESVTYDVRIYAHVPHCPSGLGKTPSAMLRQQVVAMHKHPRQMRRCGYSYGAIRHGAEAAITQR